MRDSRSQLSEEQWQNILLSSLLHRRITAQTSDAHTVEKLEINATIAEDSLSIHFRNNISGIIQKLGEIQLKQDEKEEIDSISWCGTAVQRGNDLEAEVQDLTNKYEEQGKTIEKLNQQLEDLIEAKKSHENALLEKFRELLNAKKLKIRDQQRLLAGAKVDPTHAAKIQYARSAPKTHTPTASRASKRKAKGDATASESSEEDSFEPKAVAQKDEVNGSEEADNTPEASDDATEDESDDDLDSAPRPSIFPTKTKAREDEQGGDQKMQTDELPPTRQLPFEKSDAGGGREQVSQPTGEDRSTLNQEAGNEDDETDDDDEL